MIGSVTGHCTIDNHKAAWNITKGSCRERNGHTVTYGSISGKVMDEISLKPDVITNDFTLKFYCDNLPIGLKIEELTGIIFGKTPFTYSGNLLVEIRGERSSSKLVSIKIGENEILKNNFCDADTRLSNYGSILYKRCEGNSEGVIRMDCSTNGKWNENANDIQCYDDREVKEVSIKFTFQLNKYFDDVDISKIKQELTDLFEVLEAQVTTKRHDDYLNVTIVYSKTELMANNGRFLKVDYSTVLTNFQLNIIWNQVDIEFVFIIVKTTTPETNADNVTTTATEKPAKTPTKINVGAIVGGILGLLLLLIIIFLLFWRRRVDERREKELERSK